MAFSTTNVSKAYTGDGVSTAFPITFYFVDNTQLLVTKTNTSVTPNVTTTLSYGTDYTYSAGNPTGNIIMASAPSSSYVITIYRSTNTIQDVDFIDNGGFLATDFEKAIDRIVMMIQEIEAGTAGTIASASGNYSVPTPQTLAANATISVTGSALRQILRVTGTGGVDTVMNTTTPITNGNTDGMEIIVEGQSDTSTVSITDSGNVALNGDATLKQYDTLSLTWNSTANKWIENARSI